MNLSKLAFLCLLALALLQDLKAQKYFGTSFGSNPSTSTYSALSIGIRHEQDLNLKHALNLELSWYMPGKRNGEIKLETGEYPAPDTIVVTRVRETAFRFFLNHRWYFLKNDEKKPAPYFEYGMMLDAFYHEEELPRYDLRRFRSPFFYGQSPYFNTELNIGVSVNVALGLTIPLKGKHSIFTEVGISRSLVSATLAFFHYDRFSIPNYIHFKTGYRFAYKGRKKT